MTGYEVDSTVTEYMVALIVFWIVMVVGFLVFVRYVWPTLVRVYWSTAARLYWALRNYCHSNRTDGYSRYNCDMKGMK